MKKLYTILFCLGLLATTASAQNVSLNFKDTPLKDVLKEIQNQTDYRFVYNDDVIRASTPVTVTMVSQPLTKALDEILTKNNITYSINDKQIVLQYKQPVTTEPDSKPPVSQATLGEVSGRINDASGEGLVGAFVRVKNNASKNTITDASGNFTLKGVDPNSTLVVSYMGFETMEVNLGGRAALGNIQLIAFASPLDEVQVIAYGTTTKRLNVGNISTVKAAEIARQPVTNPLMAMSGRIPGLYISQSTGNPGSHISVQLQGQNSIRQGNNPLFVIDGVPYPYLSVVLSGSYYVLGGQGAGNPLNFISPADIESIDVLKDADATAIYGSRAANGAILITTKKGGPAERTKVEVNMQTGWSKMTRRINMLNTEQYLEMRQEGIKNENAPILATDYDINGTWDTSRYTNWQDVLLGGTAMNNMVYASVSGGTAKTQFLAGATFRREEYVFPGDFADTKGSVYFNMSHTSANQKFRFQLSGSYMLDYNKMPLNDLTPNALSLVPVAPALYTADGEINWAPNESGISTFSNPLAINEGKTIMQTTNLIGNAVLSYRITPDLTIQASLGYTDMHPNQQITLPVTMGKPENRPNTTRQSQTMLNQISSWVIEPQATFNKEIGPGKLEALVGFSMQRNSTNGVRVYGYGYSSDLLMGDLGSATSVTPRSEFEVYKYAALFGRVKYNLLNKYIIDLSARRDGSSRFGTENRFHNFGAVGAAWIFSEEQFIKDKLPFLSYGKIRGSYGTTGNDQIYEYTYLSLYSSVTTSTTAPYQSTSGLKPSRLPNPFLQWEETRKLQFGLDLGFFKERILINAGYYYNRSSNQLLNYSLPSMTGFTTINMNFPALLQNTGWELSLNTINFMKKDFSWTTGFNITLPKNKLVDFPELASSSYANTYVIGKPISIVKLIPFLGVNPQTGIYQFADKDGNPTSTPNTTTDRTIIQQTNPYFFGGFDNSFIYKNFELNVFFQFVKQDGLRYYFGTSPGNMYNQPVTVLQRWQKEGDVVPIQRFSKTNPSSITSPLSNTSSASSAAYEDASYLRLKNVSFSYQLPHKWVEKIHVDNCKVYVQGQNVLTITNYSGLDPETRSTSLLPPVRTITVGIQLGL